MNNPLFKNILATITGSENSIQTVQYAVLMARHYGCKVHAVYVVDTATIKQLLLNKIFVEEESQEYQQSLEATGKRYLNYVKELGATKDVEIEIELRYGSVWSEIVKAASEKEIDAIIVPSDEVKSHEVKNILSHTFNEIVFHAPCSIIIVKEDMVDKLYKSL